MGRSVFLDRNPTHLVMDISGYFIEPPTGPPPTIVQMTPGSAVAGSAAFTMTLTGTNFVPASVVQFNGSARTTTFVSSTQLQAAITAADVASVAMAHVAVLNPQANGGISADSTFLVGSTGGPGFAVAIVNQQAQRLLYDPLRQVIYAAVPIWRNHQCEHDQRTRPEYSCDYLIPARRSESQCSGNIG